jgi:hypothetical protein
MKNNTISLKFQRRTLSPFGEQIKECLRTDDITLTNKLFFKITNADENHNGFQYVDGLNILDKEFEEEGSCVAGGLYFTDSDNILDFLDYGINLREIILPLNDPNFKCVKDQSFSSNKWRANMIILGKKYDLTNIDTFKYLISLGINLRTNDDYAIKWASTNGHLEIVKYLVELGADFRADNNYAGRMAFKNGHFKIFIFFVNCDVDSRVYKNDAIQHASKYGYSKIVKCLFEFGAELVLKFIFLLHKYIIYPITTF